MCCSTCMLVCGSSGPSITHVSLASRTHEQFGRYELLLGGSNQGSHVTVGQRTKRAAKLSDTVIFDVGLADLAHHLWGGPSPQEHSSQAPAYLQGSWGSLVPEAAAASNSRPKPCPAAGLACVLPLGRPAAWGIQLHHHAAPGAQQSVTSTHCRIQGQNTQGIQRQTQKVAGSSEQSLLPLKGNLGRGCHHTQAAAALQMPAAAHPLKFTLVASWTRSWSPSMFRYGQFSQPLSRNCMRMHRHQRTGNRGRVQTDMAEKLRVVQEKSEECSAHEAGSEPADPPAAASSPACTQSKRTAPCPGPWAPLLPCPAVLQPWQVGFACCWGLAVGGDSAVGLEKEKGIRCTINKQPCCSVSALSSRSG